MSLEEQQDNETEASTVPENDQENAKNERIEEVREAVLASAKTILDRALPFLKNPRGKWPEIQQEEEDTLSFYKNYLIPLIAIRPICIFLGYGIVNRNMGASFFGSFIGMIAFFAIGLVLPYIAALIFEKVAPMCEGEISLESGVRLIGYSLTPVYFAGILTLIPALQILGIFFAVYAGYLFYLGIPVMAAVPKENIIKFLAISLVAFFAVSFILHMLAAYLTIGFLV